MDWSFLEFALTVPLMYITWASGYFDFIIDGCKQNQWGLKKMRRWFTKAPPQWRIDQ